MAGETPAAAAAPASRPAVVAGVVAALTAAVSLAGWAVPAFAAGASASALGPLNAAAVLLAAAAAVAILALRRGPLAGWMARRDAAVDDRFFQALFEENPDAVFALDPQGRCTTANPAAAELTGTPVQELVGKPFGDLVAPEHRARARRAFEKALDGAPQRLDVDIQPRHARRRALRVGLVPIVEGDRATGVLGIAEDVTEQRQAERELHAARAEAERRAREDAALRRAAETVARAFTDQEIIDAIAEGALIATGADGAFVERIVDGGRDLVVATVTGEWTPELGARRPYAGSFGEAVLLRGEPVAVERASEAGHPLTPGFAERCGECGLLGVPLVDAGQTLGVLLLVRAPERPPFTPEQRARALTFGRLASLAFRKVHPLEDSERRRRELESVLQSRSRLVRGFSHDVKNPIGAADSHAAPLEDGTLGHLDERQLEGVRRIRSSLRSALSLIDDLVAFARTDAGDVEIIREPTDVRVIVHDLREEYRAQAEAAGLDIEIEPPPALNPIPTDAGRVRRILGNLVSNAVKYTPRGGHITLRVTTRDSGPYGEGGRWIAVDVVDTGPGIPKEKQEEIFDEFTRLQPGDAAGAGLGLAISRRLARAVGGDIVVRSAPGHGSTFTLWLPAAGPPERPRRDDVDPPRGEATAVSSEQEHHDTTGVGLVASPSPEHDTAPPQHHPAQTGGRSPRASAVDLHELLVRRIRDIAIFALDTEGRILTWNDGAERLTGHRADEVLGRNVSILHTQEQIARNEVERVLRAAARRGHFTDEGWRVRRDGSRFWACTSVTPLRDPAGRLIGYAKVVTDLTDRKREEDRQRFLATASRELAGSLDHRATLGRIARLAVPRIADIAAVYTFEDHQPTRLERVEATPDAMRTLREIEERCPGEARRLRPVVELARRRRPMVVQVTDDDLRKAAIDEGHLALLRRLRMRSIMVLPLEARGRLLGVIVLIRDATRRPYTAADLTLGEDLARRAALAVDNARLYEAALVANRARSDFLAIMSHELRTPLNAIVGYADLLLAGVPDPPPPGARRQILRIMASARHLRELIEDILSYSRIEAGREDVTLATTDLRNTLARVARTAGPLAAEKGLRFEFELPEEPLVVETDEPKVRQLLLQLLANAVKFTDRGEIGLSARKEGDQVVIAVRDTGIGIAPQDLERIFEPFWQVEQVITRRAPGTGLGLTLARRLARLLGGDVSVTSEPGRGSTFTVRLPATGGQQRAAAAS